MLKSQKMMMILVSQVRWLEAAISQLHTPSFTQITDKGCQPHSHSHSKQCLVRYAWTVDSAGIRILSCFSLCLSSYNMMNPVHMLWRGTWTNSAPHQSGDNTGKIPAHWALLKARIDSSPFLYGSKMHREKLSAPNNSMAYDAQLVWCQTMPLMKDMITCQFALLLQLPVLPFPVVCTSVTCPFSCLSSLFSSAGSRILEFILSTPTAVSASVLNITSTQPAAGVHWLLVWIQAPAQWRQVACEPVLLSRDATPAAPAADSPPQMDEPATSLPPPASWPIAESFSELIDSQKAQFLCFGTSFQIVPPPYYDKLPPAFELFKRVGKPFLLLLSHVPTKHPAL